MKKLLSFFIIILISNQLIGQTEKGLNKEVEVVKPYKPTIRETIKISDMPRFQPQVTERPDFNYDVHQQIDITPRDADTIRARGIETMPIKQGVGLIRIGVGNYQLPYGELFLNAQLGSATNIGLNFSHLNSIGKITLGNNDRVEAPSSETNAEIYLNHYFDKMTAQGRFYFDRQAFRYYGYTGDKLSDDEKRTLMPWWDYKQAFPTLGFEINIGGNTAQNNFKYDGSINIQHFETKTGQKEGLFKLAGRLEQDFKYFNGRLNFAIFHVGADSIYNTSLNSFEDRSQTYLEISPSVGISSDIANLRVGLNSIIGIDPNDNFDILQTPMAEASWSPIKNRLTLFSEMTGYMKYNHYSAIAAENKYANPYRDIKNTKYKFIINGGIRGRFDQSFSYNLKVEHATIKNYNFYYLKNQEIENADIIESIKSNTFDMIYDDITQFSIGTELLYNWENDWSVLLKAAYYGYNTNNQFKAWNLPNFEASISFRYNMPVEPLRFTADINYIGKRKGLEQTIRYNSTASIFEETTTSIIWDLPEIIDFSLGAEYMFSRHLSFWTKVNNMTTEKYERWQGYANKRLNFIAGLSFSF